LLFLSNLMQKLVVLGFQLSVIFLVVNYLSDEKISIVFLSEELDAQILVLAYKLLVVFINSLGHS
jgi:hypothetical protein